MEEKSTKLPNKKLAVISIVNHGHKEDIKLLLEDIDQALSRQPVTSHDVLVLISNNLKPVRIDAPFSTFKVTYIDNLRPKGFGDNQNTACATISSDLFNIVNPDVRLSESFNFQKLFDETPQRGVLTPIQLNSQGTRTDFLRRDLSPVEIVKRRLKISKTATTESVDWIPGAFMSFKTDFFRELKGFDTGYFMYVEDCDLCRTLKQSGGAIIVQDSNSIIHDGKRASSSSRQHLLWHLSSLIRYFKKKYLAKSWADKPAD